MGTLISAWHTPHNPQKSHLGWASPTPTKKSVCGLAMTSEPGSEKAQTWTQIHEFKTLPVSMLIFHCFSYLVTQILLPKGNYFLLSLPQQYLLPIPLRCSVAFPPSSMNRVWFGNLSQATTVWFWDPVSLLEKIKQFGESNKGHICVFCFMELKISGKLIQWES